MQNTVIDNYRQRRMQKFLSAETYARRIRLKHLLKCNTIPYSAQGVVLTKTVNAAGNSFGGLAALGKCHCSWSCPVCSAISVEHMRAKIDAVIHAAADQGYLACMVTFTVPHSVFDSADSVFKLLRESRSKFNVLAWRFIRKFTGPKCRSFIAYECKHSLAHGWHFHAHVLYFVERELANEFMTDATQAQINALYKRCIQRVDSRYENWRSSEDPVYISRRAFDSGDYLVKEVCKRDNRKNYSVDPITLIDSDDPIERDRYFEFAEATRGRYRFWYSANLLRSFGVTDYEKKTPSTDTALETTVVAIFSSSQWYDIRRRDDRYDVMLGLTLAASEDYTAVVNYCVEHALPLPREPNEAEKRMFAPRVEAA